MKFCCNELKHNKIIVLFIFRAKTRVLAHFEEKGG